MAKIKYIEFNGTEHEADVANGLSVMEGAIQNDIPGIDADCGGGMSCATCHVYINDDEWFKKLPEKEMGELFNRMLQVGKEAVKQDHTEITKNAEVKPVLNASVLDRLERRFTGNQEGLAKEAKEFIQKAASSSRYMMGETQPSVYQSNTGVPTMHRKRMIVGIPKHAYADTIIKALNDALPGASNYYMHIYMHTYMHM